MKEDALHKTANYRVQSRRHRLWKRTVGVLACAVVFCTTYMLILPAITLEGSTYCAIESHEHSEECYERTLVCGMEESEEEVESSGHVHTDECYEMTLICEKEEHTHELTCYSNAEADVESEEDWVSSVAAKKLTGNWRSDLIAVAESQLGYAESSENYIVAEDGETKSGYTRYGAWYGVPYGDWCGMFVSFCLHYANIPVEAFPQEASCPRWVELLQGEDYGLFTAAADGYEPQAGDLVFFDYDGDGSSDHMGIVAERVEDGQGELAEIKTIEGNAGDEVQYVTYSMDDKTIMGYGMLPENPASGIMPQAIPETAEPARTTEDIELHMHICSFDGNYSATDNKQHYKPQEPEVVTVDAGKAYTYVDDGAAYYLIPIRYFEEGFGSESLGDAAYQFDVDRPCPFQYGQDKEAVMNGVVRNWDWDSHPLTLASYEELNDAWYVKLQETNGENWKNIYFAELHEATDTVSPSNAVINVFDYWTEAKGAVDVDRSVETNELGINANHPLKFYWDSSGTGDLNNNTVGGGVIQGIVVNTLGEDGYPYLSGKLQREDTSPSQESLGYLFDPNYTGPENDYREVHTNVKNLLSYDDEGYFWFDAAKRGAKYDEAGNSFIEYTTPVVVAGGGSPFGQFFPFEDAHQAALQSSRDVNLRHYFGMTLATRFVQQYGGHTNATRTKPTTFTFTGDDDVWIFIDGVLVADLGGTHSSNSVEINFVTGEVTIWGVSPGKVTTTTTIYKQFQAAGRAGEAKDWAPVPDGSEPVTFADNTTHSLNFYYLERGNWDSTMSLRYNLSEIPPTAVYKVNQYGNAVAGAGFSVFAANGNYQILTNKDGEVAALPEEYQYNEAGDMVDGAGNVLVRALYRGITDANGEMIFADQYGTPYSLADLEKMFGKQFILKETVVPDGYRMVSDEIHLRIQSNALVCDNTYGSGVWASPTLKVTAPNTLTLVNGRTENYYSPGTSTDRYESTINGTLFAVALKYIGPMEENGLVDPEKLGKQEYWVPVYGNAKDGYMLGEVRDASREAFIDAVIAAAKTYGERSVFSETTIGTMEANLENLPGKVMNYYHMLGTGEKEKTQYTIGYYWTSASSLEEAASSNTFRVDSENQENSFYRTFGADIEVPNLANRLLVQKYDEDGNLVNGATFALFKANEAGEYLTNDGRYVSLDDKTYVADATEESLQNNEYTIIATPAVMSEDGKTVVTGGTGVIKLRINDEIITMTPHERRSTNGQVLEGSDGTCVFGIWGTELLPGCYYLREVDVPENYKLNLTPVMVKVTERAIYANAGTADDGVTVARGPGYIVSPLHKAAADDDVDNTLTWVYQKLRILVSDDGYSFRDVQSSTVEDWTYVKEADGKDLTSYLTYSRDAAQLGANRYLANYTPRDSKSTLKLSTDVGWSYNEIYQDYEYGKNQAGSANYTQVEGDISNLFSRSVYVQVTDKKVSNLEISKMITGEGSDQNDEFYFTVKVEGAEGKYPCTFYSLTQETHERTVIQEDTVTFTNHTAYITLKGNQLASIAGLPGGAVYSYTVTEKPEGHYSPSYSVDGGESVKGHVASGTLGWKGGAIGDNTSTVVFTNEYTAPLNLTLRKLAAGTQEPMSNVRFVLHLTGGAELYYKTDGSKSSWVPLGDDETPESVALSTDEQGRLAFTDIPDGSYSLREIATKDGYNVPVQEITFTVENGQVKIPADFKEFVEAANGEVVDGAHQSTVTVYNSPGYKLPETGGAGTGSYTMGGLAAILVAGLLLYRKNRRRREDYASS